MFADLRKTEFLTMVGIPVIVRMPMFWTDSMRLQRLRPIKGVQEEPEYVRIGET
jgi:hypothetical protein